MKFSGYYRLLLSSITVALGFTLFLGSIRVQQIIHSDQSQWIQKDNPPTLNSPLPPVSNTSQTESLRSLMNLTSRITGETLHRNMENTTSDRRGNGPITISVATSYTLQVRVLNTWGSIVQDLIGNLMRCMYSRCMTPQPSIPWFTLMSWMSHTVTIECLCFSIESAFFSLKHLLLNSSKSFSVPWPLFLLYLFIFWSSKCVYLTLKSLTCSLL